MPNTMIMLSNGCYRSEFSVTPTNWKTKSASIKRRWRIHYRFYDPSQKDHPLYNGVRQMTNELMNKFKTVEERQRQTAHLIAAEKELIDQRGYNPITGKFMSAELGPQTGLIKALQTALEKLDSLTQQMRVDMQSVLKYFEQSALQLNLATTPICKISRKNIRDILDNCKNLTVTKLRIKTEVVNEKIRKIRKWTGKTYVSVKEEIIEKKVWTPNQFNHYRAHLLILYNELEELEVVDYNPIEKIRKKEVEKGRPELLSEEQRQLIDEHLEKVAPAFRRFVHIFFHSGARPIELLRVPGKDVRLPEQKFHAYIKKGRKGSRYKWEWKVIKDVALAHWEEAMQGCGPDDYVFSYGLVPGKKMISRKIVTNLWNQYVKKDLGIDVDLYELKKLHTTEISDLIDEDDTAAKEAAAHNSHTTTAMVANIYDVKYKERKGQKVKKLGNKFA